MSTTCCSHAAWSLHGPGCEPCPALERTSVPTDHGRGLRASRWHAGALMCTSAPGRPAPRHAPRALAPRRIAIPRARVSFPHPPWNGSGSARRLDCPTIRRHCLGLVPLAALATADHRPVPLSGSSASFEYSREGARPARRGPVLRRGPSPTALRKGALRAPPPGATRGAMIDEARDAPRQRHAEHEMEPDEQESPPRALGTRSRVGTRKWPSSSRAGSRRRTSRAGSSRPRPCSSSTILPERATPSARQRAWGRRERRRTSATAAEIALREWRHRGGAAGCSSARSSWTARRRPSPPGPVADVLGSSSSPIGFAARGEQLDPEAGPSLRGSPRRAAGSARRGHRRIGQRFPGGLEETPILIDAMRARPGRGGTRGYAADLLGPSSAPRASSAVDEGAAQPAAIHLFQRNIERAAPTARTWSTRCA